MSVWNGSWLRWFVWMQGVLLLGLSLAGCGAYTPQVHTPALWKATSDQGSMYFFGAVHVGHATYYPLHPAIEKAYQESTKLVVEVDLLNLDTEAFNKLSQEAQNEVEGGKKKVSEETELKVKRALANRGVNANDYYNRYKFWYLLELLTQKTLPSGIRPEYGVDAYFLKKAQADKKPISELETIRSQVMMLVNLGENHPNTYFKYLSDPDYQSFSIVRLLTLWKQGDPTILAESLFAPLNKNSNFSPVYNALYFDRNKQMADKLLSSHTSKDVPFVVVGAGHLVGDQSMLTHLQAKGFKIEQVSLPPVVRETAN
ncbi:MAG: TraB/GumN family protein [Deltaproteobacteria bacterium]|nr:MAG: TraB/GumN family protein [Deltaproteobacteria bacterium]